MTKKEKSNPSTPTSTTKSFWKPNLTRKFTEAELKKDLEEILVEEDGEDTWVMHVGLGPKIVLNRISDGGPIIGR